MKPRHRAKIRLARTSPGDRTRSVRPLVDRVQSRQDRGDRPVELPIPWKKLVYQRKAVPLARYKLAKVEPNAPLLKRIVRHPYALEPRGTRRIQVIDAELAEPRPTGTPEREPVRIVFATMRTERQRPSLEIPEIPRRRAPFARQRAALEESRLESIYGEGSCTTI